MHSLEATFHCIFHNTFPFPRVAAITLFEVFMHILEEHKNPTTPWPSVWSVLPTILKDICK